jgi:hypothetical protein
MWSCPVGPTRRMVGPSTEWKPPFQLPVSKGMLSQNASNKIQPKLGVRSTCVREPSSSASILPNPNRDGTLQTKVEPRANKTIRLINQWMVPWANGPWQCPDPMQSGCRRGGAPAAALRRLQVQSRPIGMGGMSLSAMTFIPASGSSATCPPTRSLHRRLCPEYTSRVA